MTGTDATINFPAMTSLPEVHFADADGPTLAVYRKLMTAAGSGSPALIFRHMATYPGLLDWFWRAVGPEVEAGWPCRAVWDIVARQPVVPLPAFTSEGLTQSGVDAAARATIGHMLTSYNRMNPMNLVATGAARAMLTGDLPEAGAFDETPSAPPAPPPDLPRPLPIASLAPALHTSVRALCRTIPDIGVDVTPTMYLHFAHWPKFVALVAERLDPAMDRIDAATHALHDACRPLIGALLEKAQARNSGPPPMADPAPLVKVLDGFAYVIPHMVVVGTALETALADA